MPSKKHEPERDHGRPVSAGAQSAGAQIRHISRPGIDYRCEDCGKRRKRADLVAKRVSWMEMGEGAKTIRARVIKWQCRDCMANDPEYNRERFAESPGYADTELAREAEMRRLANEPDDDEEEET